MSTQLMTSDHFSISFNLNFSTPKSQTDAIVTFCKCHKTDKEKMETELLSSELLINPCKEADALYNLCMSLHHATLSGLIDKHAPSHTKHTCSRLHSLTSC